uniref:Uncharacterized protein n=1 Tax=Chenopodium quinoa TaxID=63459 RepID=A0A803N8S1_CHEQI
MNSNETESDEEDEDYHASSNSQSVDIDEEGEEEKSSSEVLKGLLVHFLQRDSKKRKSKHNDIGLVKMRKSYGFVDGRSLGEVKDIKCVLGVRVGAEETVVFGDRGVLPLGAKQFWSIHGIPMGENRVPTYVDMECEEELKKVNRIIDMYGAGSTKDTISLVAPSKKKFLKDSFRSGYGGCLVFLLIFYLDHLQRVPVQWGVGEQHPMIPREDEVHDQNDVVDKVLTRIAPRLVTLVEGIVGKA